MAKLFDDNRHYTQDDPVILELLGSTDKQAQMRYHKRSPSFYRNRPQGRLYRPRPERLG